MDILHCQHYSYICCSTYCSSASIYTLMCEVPYRYFTFIPLPLIKLCRKTRENLITICLLNKQSRTLLTEFQVNNLLNVHPDIINFASCQALKRLLKTWYAILESLYKWCTHKMYRYTTHLSQVQYSIPYYIIVYSKHVTVWVQDSTANGDQITVTI